MRLIASGKWSKEEGRWNMVVAMRRPVETAAPPRRKPLLRAEVIPLKSLRQRLPAK
jgi:hypothetical protein